MDKRKSFLHDFQNQIRVASALAVTTTADMPFNLVTLFVSHPTTNALLTYYVTNSTEYSSTTGSVQALPHI